MPPAGAIASMRRAKVMVLHITIHPNNDIVLFLANADHKPPALPSTAQRPDGQCGHLRHPYVIYGYAEKSSFPRRRESRILVLLGFAVGKHDFSE